MPVRVYSTGSCGAEVINVAEATMDDPDTKTSLNWLVFLSSLDANHVNHGGRPRPLLQAWLNGCRLPHRCYELW